MGLTLVAGAPERTKPTPKTDAQDDTLFVALSSAFLKGEYHYRMGRHYDRERAALKPKADRLHDKVFDRPDLAGHPKWQEAKDRLDDMERTLLHGEAEQRAHERQAEQCRGQCVSLWMRSSEAGRAHIERIWQTRAVNGETFARWLREQWEQEVGSAGGLECPF
jgi:hypothetical protein